MKVDRIAESLKRAYAHKCRKERVAFLALVVCGTLLGFFVVFLLDYLTRFPMVVRVLLTFLNLGFFFWYLPKRRRSRTTVKRSVIDIAREVELKACESRTGGFQSVLVSAVEFARAGTQAGSRELRGRVVKQAHGSSFDPAAVTLHDAVLVRQSRKLLVLSAVVYALWGGLGHHALLTFYGRAAGLNLHYLSRTRIVEVECRASVARYADVNVRVLATGVLPSKGKMVLRYKGKDAYTIPITLEGKDSQAYAAVIKEVSDSLSFHVEIGDDRSAVQKVEVVSPPVVGDGSISIDPPEYTGLEKRTVELGSFEVLQGSTYTMRVTPSKAVKSCALLGDEGAVEMQPDGDSFVLENRMADHSRGFGIRLVDKRGVENRKRLRHTMNVVPDRPPLVTLQKPVQGAYFAPPSRMRWSFRATDDFGMLSAVLVYTVSASEIIGEHGEVVQEAQVVHRGEVTLADLKGERDVELSGVLTAGDLGAAPDQSVEMRIIVTDRCTSRQDSLQGESQVKTINMVSRTELKRIITEELHGAHMLVKDIGGDMASHKKALDARLAIEQGK